MDDESRGPDEERPTAEEMLERVRQQAGMGARGLHRIYLGMAPGVGKTYRMLEEGNRRKARGTDVVIGYVETYNRPRTIEAIGNLEIIPRKKIPYKSLTLEEMDTDAVIRRHPQVALVDEIAHTNAPGSQHEKRWQDVNELLEHGITVISTLNIQHIESLADIAESITGVPVRERIPDRVVDEADELELVDMTPHALRQRMKHGNIYPPDRAEQALRQYFREGNLSALRELALRRVSATVEEDLEDYMHRHKIEQVWPAGDRVLVGVDEHANSQRVIRRAWRLANRLQADFIAVWVEMPHWAGASPEAKRQLEENLRLAEDLGAKVLRVEGDDIAKELVRVAREQNAASIVIGRPGRHGLLGYFRGSLPRRLVAAVPEVDVIVVGRAEAT
ncbi:MAG: universal stress protein [Chloroflexi bacterium]|nr:universal stress protein [Chloroflexota bacterium]